MRGFGRTHAMASRMAAEGGRQRILTVDARAFVERTAQAGYEIPFLIDIAGFTFRVEAMGDSWLDVVPEAVA